MNVNLAFNLEIDVHILSEEGQISSRQLMVASEEDLMKEFI